MADMISLIISQDKGLINKAKIKEIIAASSKNLKGTYKSSTREGAFVQTAAAMKLARRDSSTEDVSRMKKENLL